MTLADRVSFATQTARAAGKLAQNLRRDPTRLKISQKGHQDFVTAADMAVEAFIRTRIQEVFGDEAVLGEETGMQGTGDHLWILDPIDGTTNFMHGLPDWAVSIAYCHAGDIQLGVIFAPDLDLMAAGRCDPGGVAHLNGVPMTVSAQRAARRSLITVGWSPRTDFADHVQLLSAVIDGGAEYRRPGAATIGLMGVAAGWVHGYVEKSLNVWDAAAGIALIRAAGGLVHAPLVADYVTGPAPFLAICCEDHELAPTLRRHLAF